MILNANTYISLINILLLVIISLQIILGKYARIYLPVMWFFINVALIQILWKVRTNENTQENYTSLKYLFLYLVVTLITILLQPIFLYTQSIGSEKYLLTSILWLIPMQLFYWFQLKVNLSNGKRLNKTQTDKSLKTLFTEIKNLIRRNEIELAIKKMQLANVITQNERNEIDSFDVRYKDVKRKNRLGELSNEELTIEKNRIINALIELISMIESRS